MLMYRDYPLPNLCLTCRYDTSEKEIDKILMRYWGKKIKKQNKINMKNKEN